MVDEVLFEHQAPAFDGIQERLLEGTAVTLQPTVEHSGILKLGHFFIELFISVNLETAGGDEMR